VLIFWCRAYGIVDDDHSTSYESHTITLKMASDKDQLLAMGFEADRIDCEP
jgi:hypothetical protein